ncbi:MAG: NUDIX domain-containing protein [Candidatus Woesearchaeota archaeon]
MITEKWEQEGLHVDAVWRDAIEEPSFTKVPNVRGFAFTKDGKLVVLKGVKGGGKWKIPGGKIDKGETSEEALVRELEEEVSVRIGAMKLLGAQEVNAPGYEGPEGEHHFQLIFAAIIEEVHRRTVDPDRGITWPRKFINPKDFEEVVGWGAVMNHARDLAVEAFERWKKTGKL